MTDLHPSDTLANLSKAFPIGPRIGIDREIPRDAFGARNVIKVKRAGTVGYTTPYGICRRTVRGKRYLEAEWMDTANRALFTRQRDAADFLDLHRYAEGYRRITGELPAWATEG